MNSRRCVLLSFALSLAGLGCVAPGELENPEAFAGAQASTSARGGNGGQSGSNAGRGAGGGGSGGMSGAGGGGSVAGCAEACTLFAQRCGTGGCHDASGTSAGLNLATTGLAARLMGVMAKSGCTGQLLLNSASPNSSVIVSRISGSSCGLQMPPTGNPLSATEVDCIKRWVASPGCSQ